MSPLLPLLDDSSSLSMEQPTSERETARAAAVRRMVRFIPCSFRAGWNQVSGWCAGGVQVEVDGAADVASGWRSAVAEEGLDHLAAGIAR
ncbi:hypothetical protein GCM10012276_12500 [Nocardioides deserti]|nr:hypothetical protein GCM10012276_12500 [Nocardioides deserti]